MFAGRGAGAEVSGLEDSGFEVEGGVVLGGVEGVGVVGSGVDGVTLGLTQEANESKANRLRENSFFFISFSLFFPFSETLSERKSKVKKNAQNTIQPLKKRAKMFRKKEKMNIFYDFQGIFTLNQIIFYI